MNRLSARMLAFSLMLFMLLSMLTPVALASEVEDPVEAVVAQLEAIDTLQQMQDKRSTYKVNSAHYDTGTTDSAVIEEHETVRAAYEAYLSEMFAARIAAQQAYDALSSEQKARVDSSLVAKLDNSLPTVFNSGTYSVTPDDDEYTFETVKGGAGYGYEVGNYMVSGNIPQTFILVDTSDGKTSWTPSGRYVFGESNYDVTYCCDILTTLEYTTDYKRVNLEDSNYYGPDAAKHIRAILQNSYPFVSMEEMKEWLKRDLDDDFVDSLNRADLISAVQMAVWAYANSEELTESLGYFASINVPVNQGIYFTALHDYTNEIWEWLPGKRQRSYDARAAYRVNNLAYYLCNLPGEDPDVEDIIITNVEVARADLIEGSNDKYHVGLHIYLNVGGGAEDNLKITVSSYDKEGNPTGKVSKTVNQNTSYDATIPAKVGDTIKVVVEGTQYIGKNVYFYEPEGGRDASQSLVGVAEGRTKVRAEKEFVFENDIERGLRIYKSDLNTHLPISEITFNVYKVELEEGEVIGATPTEADVAKFAVKDNCVGTVVTDITGYGKIELEKGTYLIVEEPSDKVERPVDPFFISIPMNVENVRIEGSDETETVVSDIVSVYPKNELKEEPEPTPDIPTPPGNVTGRFTIVKTDAADEEKRLEGAVFDVYRPATAEDKETTIIEYDNVQYAVVLHTTLTTGENGTVESADLPCGVYFLVETKAPDGYNLLKKPVKVTVVSDVVTSSTLVDIPNERGHIMPETGGMGTGRIVLTGSVLVAAAVILMIAQKRRSAVK